MYLHNKMERSLINRFDLRKYTSVWILRHFLCHANRWYIIYDDEILSYSLQMVKEYCVEAEWKLHRRKAFDQSDLKEL